MKFPIEYYLSKAIKKFRLRAIKNCRIHKTSKVCAGSHLVNVSIDKHSDIGYDCTIINSRIGAFCSFASNIIIGGASHTIDWVSTSPVFNENRDHLKKKFSYHKFNSSLQTNIGNDVWIGDKSLIKAGVNIRNGSVIGMGSIVTKNIPPYEIWAGNPAKMIRKRFNDDIIKELERIKWWEFDDKTIEIFSETFCNVEEFIERYRK
jgi:acetyltransferase-like isoleucine patch superfamily enzyme